MKVKIFTLALFLFWPIISFAQLLKMQIINSENKEPIAHVAIFSKDNKEGTYTDEKGNVQFEFSPSTDTILLSALGYELRKLDLKQALGGQIVSLTPRVIQLPDVVVTSKTPELVEQKLGYFKMAGKTMFMSTNQHNRIALLIDNPIGQSSWISKLQYQFSGWGDEVVKTYRIKLRVYANEEGVPGFDLWSNGGWLELSPGQNKLEYDISAEKLPMPIEGVFMGFDFLGYVDKMGMYHPFVKGQRIESKSILPHIMSPRMKVLKGEKGMSIFETNGLGVWKRSAVEQFGVPMFGLVASFKAP